MLRVNLPQSSSMTSFVDDIISKMESAPVFAYAVSGAGKTATAFSIARKRHAIYFDWNGGNGKVAQRDVTSFFEQNYLSGFDWEVGFCSLLLARLVALSKAKQQDFTAEEWLWYKVDHTFDLSTLFYQCLKLQRNDILESCSTLLDNDPTLVIFDEAQELDKLSGLWQTLKNEPRPMGYGLVKKLRTYRTYPLVLGISLRLKQFRSFSSNSSGVDKQSYFVTAFPFLGSSGQEPSHFTRINFIPNGANDYLKHFLNISEETCAEIARLVAGRPRLSASIVALVARAQPPCQTNDDVLRIARGYVENEITLNDDQTMFNNWSRSFPKLSEVKDRNALAVGPTPYLRVLQNFLLLGRNEDVYDHSDQYDVVNRGIALVAKDESTKVCIIEPLSLLAGVNFVMSKHPDLLSKLFEDSYLHDSTQSGRGKSLEFIISQRLLLNPYAVLKLIPGMHAPNLPRERIWPKIQVGVALTPKLLESASAHTIVIVMPEEAAGADIVVCDGRNLFIYNSKTTEADKLDAEAARKNRLRCNPVNFYTCLSQGAKNATKYSSGINLEKHNALQAFLKKKKYNIIRVCVDYPATAPSCDADSNEKKVLYVDAASKTESLWKVGYSLDNTSHRILIDESNIEVLVGDFAKRMKTKREGDKSNKPRNSERRLIARVRRGRELSHQ